MAEDLAPYEDDEMGEDDSEIPTREVVQHVVAKKTRKNRKAKAAIGNAAGALTSTGEAEGADAEVPETEVEAPEAVVDEVEPNGKRKRTATKKYNDFWRHVVNPIYCATCLAPTMQSSAPESAPAGAMAVRWGGPPHREHVAWSGCSPHQRRHARSAPGCASCRR